MVIVHFYTLHSHHKQDDLTQALMKLNFVHNERQLWWPLSSIEVSKWCSDLQYATRILLDLGFIYAGFPLQPVLITL